MHKRWNNAGIHDESADKKTTECLVSSTTWATSCNGHTRFDATKHMQISRRHSLEKWTTDLNDENGQRYKKEMKTEIRTCKTVSTSWRKANHRHKQNAARMYGIHGKTPQVSWTHMAGLSKKSTAMSKDDWDIYFQDPHTNHCTIVSTLTQTKLRMHIWNTWQNSEGLNDVRGLFIQ